MSSSTKAVGKQRRALGIAQRTALLSWLVTTSTLLLFAVVIIPQERRIFLEQLESKARSVAVSLREVSVGAAVNEDFSTVVEHCSEMLAGDQEIEYLVVTKNDGLALIHDRNSWHSEPKGNAAWLPPARVESSGIVVMPGERRAFLYSQPLEYSGIQWGWIHVGLSLERYDRRVAAIYQRTIALAIACIVLSLLGSIVYAKRLVRPILSLRNTVQVVAGGDLSVRATVESRDELGALASSVNAMTAALLHRDQVSHSVRFAAQQFLSTSKWDEVIQEVLSRIGQAARVSRVSVFENRTGDDGALAACYRYEWHAPLVAAQLGNPTFRRVPWSTGLAPWANQLSRSESVSIHPAVWTLIEQRVLERLEIRSLLLLPIAVDGVWWGILGLSDGDGTRQWPDAERASFRAAADMLGAAISRQRTQDALLVAKEAAETANRAKSQFLANMSHEIRTPINGVMGMVRLLSRTPLSEKQRHYLGNTMISADMLLSIIGDVLDFSKIEAGKLELDEEVFSPANTVDDAVGLLVERAEAKGLELVTRIADDLPPQLRGDPDRVKQVLLNLMSNAVKFTSQGTVTVSCSLLDGKTRAPTLRFEVRDTGAGISPEHQAMIFDPFYQADASMSRSHGGTGLGLSISRELVRLMDGQIGVESAPGEGSTFWFTARFKPVSSRRTQLERRDLRRMRVLVAD
ncbi:MAG TPA: ATP-binding protein, partial [Anaeromyxobacteraceae bacterium]|nr:ATP-binding protein [Anaeromyxobacteraceae bacterium]